MIRRPKNPPKIVFCALPEHAVEGAPSTAHLISADCQRPVTARLVVCDAHTRDGEKFVPHRRSFACRNAVVVVELGAGIGLPTGVGR